MIRVGVIGAGTMGQHHARVYSELGAQLIGIADPDLGRARDLASKCGAAACYSDYRDLISRVDAVTVSAPTSLHRQIAIDFVEHGVHCLVEKPIASSVDDGQEMVRAAERNDVLLMVGHIERFNPIIGKLKGLLDDGSLGDLMIISTRRVGPFVPRIRDVGIIIDSATHDIDIARYLVGREPVDVYCKARKYRHLKEDHAVVVLDFVDTVACIEVNWFTPHKVRSLVATGSEGIASLDYIRQEMIFHNSAEYAKTFGGEWMEPLKLELEHFLGCVQGGIQPLVSGEDALGTLQTALRAEESVAHV